MHALRQNARLLRLVSVAISVAGSSGDPCRNFANGRSTTTMLRLRLSGILLSTALCFGAGNSAAAAETSGVDSSRLARSYRCERDGWIYVHLEGAPDEIGYQHGALLAKEIADFLRDQAFLPITTFRGSTRSKVKPRPHMLLAIAARLSPPAALPGTKRSLWVITPGPIT